MHDSSQLKSLSLLLAIFSLLACDKKEIQINEVISYPLVVHFTGTEQQEPTRLFSKNGEIKDEAALRHFLDNFKSWLPAAEETRTEEDTTDIITFTDDSTAFFGSSDIVYRVKRNNESEFGFTSLATHTAPVSPTGVFIMPDEYYVGKYHGERYFLPSATGGTIPMERELRIAWGSFQHFRLPVLTYTLKKLSKDSEGRVVAVKGSKNEIFNEFNPDFIESLNITDTIAVQQSYIRFQK